MRVSEHSQAAVIETASAPTKSVNKRSARNMIRMMERKRLNFQRMEKENLTIAIKHSQKTESKLVGNPSRSRRSLA